MSKRPDALLCADLLDVGFEPNSKAIAAFLRKQHALNAELVVALTECADRLQIHIEHSEDLVAHMKACAVLSKAEEQQ